MDYFEIEGKALFKKYGIPTDDGILLDETTDFSALNYPVILKAQVLSGHRGQAGGVKKAENAADAKEKYDFIKSLTIGGKKVSAVMAVSPLSISKEHYVGLTLDTINKARVLLYSPDGGMDIETLAAEHPDRLLKLNVTESIDEEELYSGISALGVGKKTAEEIVEITEKLYTLFRELDGTTVEINPLAECADGSLIAADSKLVIDNSALFRHEDYTIIPRVDNRSVIEKEAADAGVSYVEVDPDGTVGLIVIGAGLGMSTLDVTKHYGLKPYDFTDLGSKINETALRVGMKLVMQNPKIDSILINGFGGNFSTLDICNWIVASFEEMHGKKIPVVVKIRGAMQEEGWQVLRDHNIPFVGMGTTDDAVKLLVKVREEARV